MKRRLMLSTIVKWVLSLPLIGVLISKNKIIASDVRIGSQFMSVNGNHFELEAVRERTDDGLTAICENLNEIIAALYKNNSDSISGLELHYRNILDRTHNPCGEIGFIRVIIRKK